MKAELSRQWALLDVQALDSQLAKLAHRARTLPVLAQIEQLTGGQAGLEEDLVRAQTAVDDVEQEVRKADEDVQLVRDRAARDQQRLDSGQGSAKELTGLQHELEALARRQAELEDLELEVMERSEAAQANLQRLQATRDEQAASLQELTGQRDTELGELDAERQEVLARREQLTPTIGDDLLALYDKIREQQGGLGAAALQGRRCGGCGLELNRSDLSRIRDAAHDEVLRCEECRRILVRTDGRQG